MNDSNDPLFRFDDFQKCYDGEFHVVKSLNLNVERGSV